MKLFKIVSLIFASAILLAGCDKIAVKNVQLPVSFKVSQKIVIPEDLDGNPDNSFLVGGEYDILNVPEVAEVAGTPEEIKKIQITKIQYRFSNFSGNVDAVVSGELLLPQEKVTSYDDIIVRFSIKPVNVANSVLLGELYTFDGDYAGVNEYLSKNSEFQFAIEGQTSRNPAIFNMELIVSAVVTTDVSINL